MIKRLKGVVPGGSVQQPTIELGLVFKVAVVRTLQFAWGVRGKYTGRTIGSMMQIARWGKQWDTFSSVKLPINETSNQAYAVNLH